ncbi:MAG: HepT-like ribonuclease domain-containing protein [Vicinamibacterales bacterium]
MGLRNRLIHGYDDVDHDIVWEIVTTDIPALVVQLPQ